MAYLYRLIFAVAFVFAALPLPSFAQSVVWEWNSCSDASLDAVGACTAATINASDTVLPYYRYSFVSSSTSTGGMTFNRLYYPVSGSPTASVVTLFATSTLTCSSPFVLSGGSCVCPSPLVLNSTGDSCISPDSALCDALFGTETYASAPGNIAPGATSCNATGCAVQYSSTVIRVRDPSGQYVTEGAASFTGASCVYSSETGSTEDTCPGGTVGEFNGLTKCVPYDPLLNTIETVKAGESTSDDGTDMVGSTSTSTTTCSNGSCTTSTTTNTTINGTPSTKTETTTESQADFCTDNPRAPQCAEPGQFGGSCGAFTCTGDAVQCALTSEVHRQNCKLNENTPERSLYEASKGDDADFDNDDVVNVGPSSFSQAPILGAASCISDKSITVMGSSVSLPFSRVCEYLAMLGNVLMAVGFLLSGRIIMRG